MRAVVSSDEKAAVTFPTKLKLIDKRRYNPKLVFTCVNFKKNFFFLKKNVPPPPPVKNWHQDTNYRNRLAIL